MIIIPQSIKEKSSVQDLQERLNWGEPALTIIDIRSRDSFNTCRIRGAISLPKDSLVKETLKNLEFERDIYIYGDDQAQVTNFASLLRTLGYRNVSELTGGLKAWKNAGFPTE